MTAYNIKLEWTLQFPVSLCDAMEQIGVAYPSQTMLPIKLYGITSHQAEVQKQS